jgi:hypothetical protein|tara:strand:+ start:4064 stop:5479 length:1416 start_codon:yes stop_codon:yes gene_type:complete
MATPEKEVVSVEVKTETKKAQKDVKSLAGEIEFMGVSLNSVKAGFKTMAATARASFATIKAAIMSTGIGLFIVAIGSLVAYFKSSEKAAVGFTKIMNGLKAAFDNTLDVVQSFGEALVRLRTEGLKGFISGLKETAETMSNVVSETKKDIQATNELAEAQYNLTLAERGNVVERAKNQKEISRLRLQARDEENFNVLQRLQFIKQANKLSEEQLKTDLRLAKERLRINLEENKVKGDLQKEELDRTAQLQADIFNIENRNAQELRRLKMEEITLTKQVEAAQEGLIKVDINRFDNFKKNQDEVIRLSEDVLEELEDFTVKSQMLTDEEVDTRLAAYSHLAGALSSLANENKELAAAGAIIDTYAGANKAFKEGGTLGFITGAAIIAQGLANVRKIYETNVPGGSGGAGSSGGGFQLPSEAQFGFTPAAQMMSGAFSLTGGEEPEAMKAFVVTDEMTNSQNQLANIRRRATI